MCIFCWGSQFFWGFHDASWNLWVSPSKIIRLALLQLLHAAAATLQLTLQLFHFRLRRDVQYQRDGVNRPSLRFVLTVHHVFVRNNFN